MKEFFAQLSDKSTIKVFATKMEKEENMIFVYYEEVLVAVVDVSAVLIAHIHDVKVERGR